MLISMDLGQLQVWRYLNTWSITFVLVLGISPAPPSWVKGGFDLCGEDKWFCFSSCSSCSDQENQLSSTSSKWLHDLLASYPFWFLNLFVPYLCLSLSVPWAHNLLPFSSFPFDPSLATPIPKFGFCGTVAWVTFTVHYWHSYCCCWPWVVALPEGYNAPSWGL